MDRKINEIIIVGGGDSGLITALCLQRLNPTMDITVIDDFAESRSNVGKSTFKPLIHILHQILGIDQGRFVRDVRPAFKASVYFKDWCDRPPFHFPFDLEKTQPSLLDPHAGEKELFKYHNSFTSEQYRTNNEEMVSQRKTPFYIDEHGRIDQYSSFAYHLPLGRFSQFLERIAKERGIALINDRITSVEWEEEWIERMTGEEAVYSADLFIDASGFSRVIKSEADSQFVDFHFPLDVAINAQFDHSISEVVPATVIETGECGWFWQIDTPDVRDIGYVYSSNHLSEEGAIEEFHKHVGRDIPGEQIGTYEFSSGFYESAWEGNHLAIGNAVGFVEPIQSTGLTVNAQSAVILSVLLASHGRINHQGIRDSYNAFVKTIWKEIYDFVALHYKFAPGENQFWQDIQSIETSERLSKIIQEYDTNGLGTTSNPLSYNEQLGNLLLFNLADFYTIMRSMGVESTFYESNELTVSSEVEAELSEQYRTMQEEVKNYLTTEQFYSGITG